MTDGLTFRRNAIGRLVMYTGGAGCVFPAERGDAPLAFKVFTKSASGRERRYGDIHAHLAARRASIFVDFQFSVQGVWATPLGCRAGWFPAVRMEWAPGKTLDAALDGVIDDYDAGRWAREWLRVLAELRRTGAAHGDLQHGNIVVDSAGVMRLIDYDGMFVPAMRGELDASEQGHPAYQHPIRSRSGAAFDEHLDDFSALVILTSLAACSRELWEETRTNEGLLLTAQDLRGPDESAVLEQMSRSQAPAPALVELLREALGQPDNHYAQLRRAASLYGVDLEPRSRGVATPTGARRSAPEPARKVRWLWELGGQGMTIGDGDSTVPAVVRGKQQVEDGKGAIAARQVAPAPAARPVEVGALIGQAASLRAAGKLSASLREAERAVELAPDLARAHLERGWTALSFSTGHDTDALEAFLRALALDPTLGEAAVGLAIGEFLRGNTDSASGLLDGAVNLGASTGEVAAAALAIEIERGNFDRLGELVQVIGNARERRVAERLRKRVMRRALGTPGGVGHIAPVAHESGPDPSPPPPRKRSESAANRRVNAARALAQRLGESGDWPGVVAACSNVLGARPDDLEALVARSSAYRHQGKLAESLKDAEHAIAIAPKDPRGHVQWGWTGLSFKSGRRDKALAAFDRAISIDKQHADAYAGRGMARLLRGHTAEARVAFATALRLDPKCPEALGGQAALAVLANGTGDLRALDAVRELRVAKIIRARVTERTTSHKTRAARSTSTFLSSAPASGRTSAPAPAPASGPGPQPSFAKARSAIADATFLHAKHRRALLRRLDASIIDPPLWLCRWRAESDAVPLRGLVLSCQRMVWSRPAMLGYVVAEAEPWVAMTHLGLTKQGLSVRFRSGKSLVIAGFDTPQSLDGLTSFHSLTELFHGIRALAGSPDPKGAA